ncbi:MAG: hypothetical protein ACK4R7_05230 [Fervidobacterium sp.]
MDSFDSADLENRDDLEEMNSSSETKLGMVSSILSVYLNDNNNPVTNTE